MEQFIDMTRFMRINVNKYWIYLDKSESERGFMKKKFSSVLY